MLEVDPGGDQARRYFELADQVARRIWKLGYAARKRNKAKSFFTIKRD